MCKWGSKSVKICANTIRDPIASNHARCKTVPGRGRYYVRKGLAPLEMVLGLPVVLLLFALLINAGFTGMWKLRLLGVGREATWRDRDQRDRMTRPDYHNSFWLQSGGVNANGELKSGQRLASGPKQTDDDVLDTLEDQGDAAAVRQQFGSLEVDVDLLDPKKDAYQVKTSTEQSFPLMVSDSLRTMNAEQNDVLVSHTLPFWETKLPDTTSRRSKILYGPVNNDSQEFREISPVETDRPGGHLPHLSNWASDTMELGRGEHAFARFLEIAKTFDESLRDENLKPLAGHDATYSTLNALGGLEAYHDPERYDWTYVGEFLSSGYELTSVHWVPQILRPTAPEFMPPLPASVFNTGTGRSGLKAMRRAIQEEITDNIKPQIEDDLQKKVDDPDPKQAEVEGNLIYHLSNEYIDFYNQAIGIVAHHVNHLQSIIDEADKYDALPSKDKIPAVSKNFKIAKMGAKDRLKPAELELKKRKDHLEPFIQGLIDFQRDF